MKDSADMLSLLLLIAADADRCTLGDPRSELLQVHETARQAHLKGDSELLASTFSDEIVSAEKGEVRTRSAGEVAGRFRAYFDRVKYQSWKDARPPVLMVSPDEKIAWMAVELEGSFTAQGATSARTFKSSWIATYRREGCEWKMTGIASSVVE